jgi:hypothetical protein
MGWQSINALRISPAPSCRLWRHLLPNVNHATSHGYTDGIQDEIRLKNWLRRQWEISKDPEVNCLQRSVTRRFNEWRNDKWSAALETLDPEDEALWTITKRVMRIPTPSPSVQPRGNRSLSF